MTGWLTLSVLWLSQPCLGQETAENATDSPPAETTTAETAEDVPPPEPEDSPPPIKTVPLAEIAIESQSALEQIRKLGPGEEKPELLATIAKQLPANKESLASIEIEIQSIISSGRIGRRARRVENGITAVSNRLEDWQNQLVSVTRDLQERLAKLKDIGTLWENTRDAIAEEEGAATLNESIRAVLDATTKTTEGLTLVRDEILSAQVDVSHEVKRLSALREELTKINQHTAKQLFRPDSPVIWSVRRIVTEDGEYGRQMSSVFHDDITSLLDMVATHPVHLTIQFLVFLATVIFLYKVRQRHQQTLTNDPRSKSAAKLLNHPIATGLVIALVLTPLLVPDPPLAFYRYTVFALLIPVIILLRTTLQEGFKRPAYFVISLYVLIRVSSHLPEFSFGQRMIELIVAVIGAAISFHQIRHLGSNSPSEQRLFKSGRILSRISFVIYCAAAVLNIFGLFALADRLLATLVGMLTLALILIAGSNAIREFLRISMVVGPLRHLSAVRYHYTTIDRKISRGLNFTASILWLIAIFLTLGLYAATRNAIGTALEAKWKIGAMNLSLGSILAFFFAIWVSVMLSRAIRFLLNADILPRFNLPRGIPSSISMMVHYCIITLGLLFALAAAGIDLSQLSIIIGALGVGIGFGLQSLVNNFVSGLILIFERPIKVGDKIQFGTNFGEVRSIGIRASNVRSFDGAEVIVPNGNLISNEVVNWTLSDQQRRMNINVGVAYGNDPEKVIELLGHVLEPFDKILKDPEPFISFDGFGESSLDFTVRFWIDDFQLGLRMKSAISIAINKALKEAKIEIPFPQRDLHLRSIDDAPARTLGATHKKKSDTDLLP